MKEKIKKAWSWLSGKKTVIGFLGTSLLKIGLVENNLDPDWAELLEWFFLAIGGTGVVHKGSKAYYKKKFEENLNKQKSNKN